MPKPNIDKLSFKELAELHKQTETRMETIREEEKSKLRSEFEQRATENGFSLAEVVGVDKLPKSRRKVTAGPKYANPSDPSQHWNGNGRVPGWLKKLTEDGTSRDKFLIS